MKTTKLLLILLFLSVSVSATTVVDSIYIGGMYRTYRLYVPPAYTGSTAWPLVFNLHGYTSNASQQQLYAAMDVIADTGHFLICYPQGTQYMGQPYWNAFGVGVDDIGFLSGLIDSLSASYNIDPEMVYSCGMSNGAIMSYTLACALENKIAAIASVTGTMSTYQYANCSPYRPVPVMEVHGTADPTVPYAGGTGMEPIDTTVKYWVTKNGCNPTAAFSNVPNINTSDGCTAEHYVWSGGLSGSSVELYKIIGGQHTWPGSPFIIGTTNEDFKASEKIWLFFKKYKKNLLTGVSELSSAEELKVYPNPANDILNIDVEGDVHVTVYDMNGKKLIETEKKLIEISGLAKGVYSVLINTGIKRSVLKFVKM
jgi:polyhydroxybutyrate depolymerase